MNNNAPALLYWLKNSRLSRSVARVAVFAAVLALLLISASTVTASNALPPPIITGLAKEGETYHIAGYVAPDQAVHFDPNVIRVVSSEQKGYFYGYAFGYDANGKVAFIRPDQNGRFEFWFSLLPGASPTIQLTADNASPLPAEPPAVPAGTAVDLNHPETVLQNPAAQKLQAEVNLAFQVSPAGITKQLSITTRVDNPFLIKLTSRQIDSVGFITAFLGSAHFGGSDFIYDFNQSPLAFSIQAGKAVVTFPAEQKNFGQINLLGSTLIESSFDQGFPLLGNTGALSIQVSGLGVDQFSPIPAIAKAGTFTWTALAPLQKISLNLTRSPKDLITSLPALQLTSLYGLQPWARDFLYLLLQGVFAVPLIWLVVLIAHALKKRKTGQPNLDRAGRILSISLAFFFFPTTWYFFMSLVNAVINADSAALSRQISVFLASFSLNTIPLEIPVLFLIFLGLAVAALLFSLFLSRNNRFAARVWTGAILGIALLGLFVTAVSMVLQATLLTSGAVPANGLLVVWGISSLIMLLISLAVYSNAKNNLGALSGRKIWKVLAPFAILVFALVVSVPNPESTALRYFVSNLSIEDPILNLFGNLSGVFYLLSFLAVLNFLAVIGAPAQNLEQPPSVPDKILQPPPHPAGYPGDEHTFLVIGQLIFAGYIISPYDQWLLIPISFLIGLWLYRYLVRPSSELATLFNYARTIRDNRAALIAGIARSMALSQLQSRLDQLVLDLSSGKVSPSDYEKSTTQIKKEQQLAQPDKQFALELPIKDIVFAVSPFDRVSKNTAFALRATGVLLIPLVIFYLGFTFYQNIYPDNPYLWLGLLVQFSLFILNWVILGYFYAVYYDYIRGTNGLKKGLYLLGFITACTLLYRLFTLTSPNDLQSFILGISQQAYFLIGLGLAFNWKILRDSGYPTRFMRIIISDLPSLVTTGSIIFSTLGVVITSLLQGQLTAVLSALVKIALPALNLPIHTP